MRDRSTTYFAFAAVVMVFIAFIILQYRHSKTKIPAVEISKSQSVNEPAVNEPAEVKFLEKGKYPSFVSGTMEPGNIRLELSPEGFENGVFKVRYFANAHDLVLDRYDLSQMTTLEYDNQRLKPSHYDKMEGHHDSGLIFFGIGKLHEPPSPFNFSITVRGLPKQETRVFSWK